jgi:molybdenum cofactor cytidylyltransferase
MRVGTIILAAGESKRLGRPKQLAIFEGRTLIERAVDTAAQVTSPVVVVLGAFAEEIRPKIPTSARAVINDQWAAGMASSIQAGLSEIESQVDAVLLMVCDQPFVSEEDLAKIIERAPAGIVAAEYEGTLGVPALFKREYFDRLRQLSGAEGAKKIILENQTRVARVPIPACAFDIDTTEDYQRLIAKAAIPTIPARKDS